MYKVNELLLSPDTFDNPIFCIHLRCFRWYGYVASRREIKPWKSLARCTILTASIWLSCMLMLARVFRGYEKLNDGATSCATAVQYFAVSIATLNAYLQRERVVNILRLAHKDIQRLMIDCDEKELQLLEHTQKYVRRITFILWVPSVVAGLMAWSDCLYRTVYLPQTVFNMPAVRRGEAQPILLFKLFPFGELCDNFVIGYLGPWYALGLGITTIPLWHTFITCLMKYVHLKLQILNKQAQEMDIKRLNRNLIIDRMTIAELDYWRLQLCKSFIQEQLRIRNFVEQIQYLICIPVMADFIIFSVLMCFLFFALMVGAPSKMDYFFIFIYLFVMASILWLYHWHATLIVECHDELSFGFYSCEWFDFSLTVQKTLLFVMMHAQRPLKMRALLVDLNLRTFIDIMRGAYSYFNLLRSSHLY
ncbi:odorant receptor 56a [Drosophila tropicalis]|uniref:odorant receptor 56a n=1 Tax=Drosophila tropicalis TaxID=46794 RepID=UPI0035AB8B1B